MVLMITQTLANEIQSHSIENRPKILIVESNPDYRIATFGFLLEQNNYEVRSAKQMIGEGLSLWKSFKPDIVIIDINTATFIPINAYINHFLLDGYDNKESNFTRIIKHNVEFVFQNLTKVVPIENLANTDKAKIILTSVLPETFKNSYDEILDAFANKITHEESKMEMIEIIDALLNSKEPPRRLKTMDLIMSKLEKPMVETLTLTSSRETSTTEKIIEDKNQTSEEITTTQKQDERKKVLIVENLEHDRIIAHSFLEDHYEVRSVNNMKDGILTWREFKPDIVIINEYLSFSSSNATLANAIFLLEKVPIDNAKVILSFKPKFTLHENHFEQTARVRAHSDAIFTKLVSEEAKLKLIEIIKKLLKSRDVPKRINYADRQIIVSLRTHVKELRDEIKTLKREKLEQEIKEATKNKQRGFIKRCFEVFGI